MGRLALALALWTTLADVADPVAPATPVRRSASRGVPSRWRWLADPRSAVLLALGSVLLFGGGRKWLKTIRGRRASARLNDPDVTPDEIAEAADYGREGLLDLFRLLGTDTEAARRDAAGRAIAALWKRDELIAEEEKALVRRGYVVDWKARRRYPRALAVPVPIRVEFGVPFLRDAPGEVGPDNLLWSYRIIGSERASLEEFTAWTKGPGRATFEINPTDFPTNGPHRLIFQARVKTEGVTDPWEFEMPHVPFHFELDPILQVDALLTLPDEARAAIIARSIRLGPGEPDGDASRFVMLTESLLLRDPPVLRIQAPLPCDLAHSVRVEIEGVPGSFDSGTILLSGQGAGADLKVVDHPITIDTTLPAGAIDRPGEVRVRAILTADPHRGWADPDVRSIWPGAITTDWAVARVVRR